MAKLPLIKRTLSFARLFFIWILTLLACVFAYVWLTPHRPSLGLLEEHGRFRLMMSWKGSVYGQLPQSDLARYAGGVQFQRAYGTTLLTFNFQQIVPRAELPAKGRSLGGFYFGQYDTWANGEPVRRITDLFIPCWFVLTLLSVCPVTAFFGGPLRRWRRRRRGQCARCGYALVELTEPRCPECGATFESGIVAHPTR